MTKELANELDSLMWEHLHVYVKEYKALTILKTKTIIETATFTLVKYYHQC